MCICTVCALDRRPQVDVVYTDLTKAFDVVNHSILINKLAAFGLCNRLMTLFKSFLSNRSQFVEYNGYRSLKYFSFSGVTQGSNLGPILFIIYFNDALSQLNCPIFAYADDLKTANWVNSIEDCILLQSDLDIFGAWCDQNRQKINQSKCKVVTFSRATSTIHYDNKRNGTTVLF